MADEPQPSSGTPEAEKDGAAADSPARAADAPNKADATPRKRWFARRRASSVGTSASDDLGTGPAGWGPDGF